jgi:hypothetical protein
MIGQTQGMIPLGDLCVNGRIILKWILEKQSMTVRTGPSDYGQVTMRGFLERCDETSDLLKSARNFDISCRAVVV